jgi:putative tricarboxylic transport membrane protein
MRKGTIILFVALVVLGGFLTQSRSLAAYPDKPIEVIVPFTAGGTNDLLMRLVGEISKKYLGQPLVIINKPGAGGSLGVAEALQAKPDGYELVSVPSNYFSTTIFTQKIPFKASDLIPIANFMSYRNGLVVNGKSPYKTLNDLLDYGKKNPGRLRWAHLNRGSALFMQTYLVFKRAGVEAVDVPYPGLPDCLNAVLGGHVDASPVSFGGSREHIKAGNIRYVVVYTEKRFPEAPDVPTAKELGYEEATKFKTLLGIYSHKDVPEGVRKTLYEAFKKTFEDPEFKKAFEAFGEDPYFAGPKEVMEQIKEESKLTVPLLKEWGLYK